MLELGSGVGVGGIAVAHLAEHVTLSDYQPDVVQVCQCTYSTLTNAAATRVPAPRELLSFLTAATHVLTTSAPTNGIVPQAELECTHHHYSCQLHSLQLRLHQSVVFD